MSAGSLEGFSELRPCGLRHALRQVLLVEQLDLTHEPEHGLLGQRDVLLSADEEQPALPSAVGIDFAPVELSRSLCSQNLMNLELLVDALADRLDRNSTRLNSSH